MFAYLLLHHRANLLWEEQQFPGPIKANRKKGLAAAAAISRGQDLCS